jgi:hypothetical protein
LDEFGEVGAGERFTARKVKLHHPCGSGFAKDATPDFGCQFFGTLHKFTRIRAVDTMQRAAMGQFGDESERGGNRHGHEHMAQLPV